MDTKIINRLCFMYVISSLLTLCAVVYAEERPFWNILQWGSNAQAWCRFRCNEKLPARNIFRVNIAGPTQNFTTFGNLKLLAREGDSYIVENYYDLWPWGKDSLCQFQFGVVFQGPELIGSCSYFNKTNLIPGIPETRPFVPEAMPAVYDTVSGIPNSASEISNTVSGIQNGASGISNTVSVITNSDSGILKKVSIIPNSASGISNTISGIPNTNNGMSNIISTKTEPKMTSAIDLATWDNTLPSNTRNWRYQGRCTFACMGTYLPGSLIVRIDVDKDTTNFNGFGAFISDTPTSSFSRSWTLVNRKRIVSNYGLCNFDFELDHRNQLPIPSGACYTVTDPNQLI